MNVKTLQDSLTLPRHSGQNIDKKTKQMVIIIMIIIIIITKIIIIIIIITFSQ